MVSVGRTLRRSPGPRRKLVHVPIRGVRRWHVNLGIFCGAVGALTILSGLIWGVVKILEVVK